MTSKELVATLSEDVRRLVAEHSAATEELRTMRQKNNDQAARIRTLQQQLKESKAEVARLQLGEALGASRTTSPAARAQINRLLREVDKCIALLSDEI